MLLLTLTNSAGAYILSPCNNIDALCPPINHIFIAFLSEVIPLREGLKKNEFGLTLIPHSKMWKFYLKFFRNHFLNSSLSVLRVKAQGLLARPVFTTLDQDVVVTTLTSLGLIFKEYVLHL